VTEVWSLPMQPPEDTVPDCVWARNTLMGCRNFIVEANMLATMCFPGSTRDI